MTTATRFAEACHRPFSNGTEGDAWISKWCDYCIHDHKASHSEEDWSQGCTLLAEVYADDWPEGWLPEPDDGTFSLPSRLVCLRFEACTEGTCTGDPGATERAERVQTVIDYWKAAK